MQPLLSNLVDPPLGFSDKTIRRVGTAGWAVPRAVAGDFPAVGSTLERYCARFDAVEINSTFYRSHRPSTYLRWAMATPPHFRFALKLPRTITHHARLVNVTSLLTGFVAEALHLGEKLGPLLVQLPPSLAYDAAVAEPFFREPHHRRPWSASPATAVGSRPRPTPSWPPVMWDASPPIRHPIQPPPRQEGGGVSPTGACTGLPECIIQPMGNRRSWLWRLTSWARRERHGACSTTQRPERPQRTRSGC
jgi:hypothetical protein